MRRNNGTTSELVKKSLGIILFDPSKNKVVAIKKRYTYAYFDFVYGRYDKTDQNTIKLLLGRMTIHEKNILRSCNFDFIWFHIHLNFTKTEKYYKAYTDFANMFLGDQGSLLIKLLDVCLYDNNVKYELPKGKKNGSCEPNIFTAIREMEEETQIMFSEIDLNPFIKKTIIEVVDGIKYMMIFYVGTMKKDKIPYINEKCRDQLTEICDVSLIDMATLRNNVNPSVYAMIKKISKTLKLESKIIRPP
jgi:hypothetical protein